MKSRGGKKLSPWGQVKPNTTTENNGKNGDELGNANNNQCNKGILGQTKILVLILRVIGAIFFFLNSYS